MLPVVPGPLAAGDTGTQVGRQAHRHTGTQQRTQQANRYTGTQTGHTGGTTQYRTHRHTVALH